MTLHPYTEQPIRTALQRFTELTQEQQYYMRADPGLSLLFHALEDMRDIVETTDESRAALTRQRDALNRALGEEQEAAP